MISPSDNTELDSSYSVDASVNGSPTKLTYENNILSWHTEQIKAEDIIGVVDSSSQSIFSLAPSNSPLAVQLLTTKTTASPPSFFAIPNRKLPQYLQVEPDLGNVLHVLVSTLSGTGLAVEFWDAVLHPLLNEIGWDDSRINIIQTSSADTVKQFAAGDLRIGAERGVRQTVLLLSGDGGIVDLINALSSNNNKTETYTKPTLIQIPLGTGNALFHSLHKASTNPSLYVQALRTLFNGTPKPLPIFRATFSPGARLLTNEGQTATPLTNNTLYGAVVVSYGLHATLVADSDTTEYRKHGDKRFGLVANDLLFPKEGVPHAYRAKVSLDGQSLGEREEHGYMLATLVSNLEKAFTVSPDSKPLDGKLRVVSFGPMSGEEAMGVMKQAYDGGKHVEMQEVGYQAVENGMRIEMGEEGEEWNWRRVCVDGLIVAVEEGGWVDIEMVKEGKEAVMIVIDAD